MFRYYVWNNILFRTLNRLSTNSDPIPGGWIGLVRWPGTTPSPHPHLTLHQLGMECEGVGGNHPPPPLLVLEKEATGWEGVRGEGRWWGEGGFRLRNGRPHIAGAMQRKRERNWLGFHSPKLVFQTPKLAFQAQKLALQTPKLVLNAPSWCSILHNWCSIFLNCYSC